MIYTKKGDLGFTDLNNKIRVSKDDIRVEVNGQLDELNALLGIVRAKLIAKDAIRTYIYDIQEDIMLIMSELSIGNMDLSVLTERVLFMENKIDDLLGNRRFKFLIPGDSETSAFIHLARTKCRTVERRIFELSKKHVVSEIVSQYINRLSDFLFSLTCVYDEIKDL